MIEVSIVMPVHNAEATLGACLDALGRQDLPRDRFEVILVDNNSTDGSKLVASRYRDVRVLTESLQSAYAARNRGVTAAEGRLIAFTDADCVPHDTWLRRLVERMADPDVHVVMGRDQPAGPSRSVRLLGEYDDCKERFVMQSPDPVIYYGHTNNLIIRREVLAEVGGFDERPRGADVILVQRVLAAYGTKAVQYEPSAVVDHLEIRSSLVYFKKAFIYGGSAYRYTSVVPARPLRNCERLHIFRSTVRSSRLALTESSFLFVLLSIGVACYGLGWLAAALGMGRSVVTRPTTRVTP